MTATGRRLKPAEAAKRIDKWAKVGFPYAQVQYLTRGLQVDREESKARAPRLRGRLASTIRVISPSSRAAAKRGVIRSGITAGSRSGSNPVNYAAPHQFGHIGGEGPNQRAKTKAHVIAPQGSGWIGKRGAGGRWEGVKGSGRQAIKLKGGDTIVRFVRHPGSQFKARGYLKVDEARLVGTMDRGVKSNWNAQVEA